MGDEDISKLLNIKFIHATIAMHVITVVYIILIFMAIKWILDAIGQNALATNFGTAADISVNA